MASEKEKLVQLARALFDKTTAGQLHWEPTANQNTFQLSLSNYSTLISKELDPDEPGHYILLRICNEEGQVIEELYEGEAVNAGFSDMRALFNLARRIAMGVDKALDEMLDVLKSRPSKK
jgi:hypothetical protein